jgi:hypothetical protein
MASLARATLPFSAADMIVAARSQEIIFYTDRFVRSQREKNIFNFLRGDPLNPLTKWREIKARIRGQNIGPHLGPNPGAKISGWILGPDKIKKKRHTWKGCDMAVYGVFTPKQHLNAKSGKERFTLHAPAPLG